MRHLGLVFCFCCLLLVGGCGVLRPKIPTDEQLIRTFIQYPECFNGLRKLAEKMPNLEYIEVSDSDDLTFVPGDISQKDNPIWEKCFRALNLKRFDPWYDGELIRSIRYTVVDFGWIGSGETKGYFFSREKIKENIFNNLDSLQPKGYHSDLAVEDVDLYRKIDENWYLYYVISY